MTWPTLSAIVAAFPAMGALVDRSMIARQKSALHLGLIDLWDRLDNVRVGDLDGTACRWLLKASSRIRRRRGLTVVVGCIASWLATNSAFYLGARWDGQQYRFFAFDDLPYGTLYFTNAVFDASTLILCFWAMTHVANTRSSLRRLAYSSINVIGALILSFGSLLGTFWTLDLAIALRLPLWAEQKEAEQVQWFGAQRRQAAEKFGVRESSVEGVPLSLAQYVKYTVALCKTMVSGKPTPYRTTVQLVVHRDDGEFRIQAPAAYQNSRWHASLLYAVTTLLPVTMLTIVMFLMLLGKLLLSVVRVVAMNYLEVATEKDPSRSATEFVPFTLLGSVLGLFALVTALTYSAIQVFRVMPR